MPGAKVQRYLSLIAFVGVLASCFGCTLLFRNDFVAGEAFLILAWVILVPLFAYLIVVRRRGKAAQRAHAEQNEALRRQELAALAGLGKKASDEGEAATPRS